MADNQKHMLSRRRGGSEHNILEHRLIIATRYLPFHFMWFFLRSFFCVHVCFYARKQLCMLSVYPFTWVDPLPSYMWPKRLELSHRGYG